MTTLAQKMSAFAAARGSLATFTRDADTDPENYDPRTGEFADGASASFSAKVMQGRPKPDDFAPGTLIERNPIAVSLPNSPAVAFPPKQGMTMTLAGIAYTVISAKHCVLDDAVQVWRVVGSAG